MRSIIAALVAASFAVSANADEQVLIARNGENSVRIMKARCHADVRAAFPHTEEWSQAVAVVNGQRYIGCWEVRGPVVVLQYLDGDVGAVPVGMFTQDHGA
jgi:hypothetical protein